MIERRVLNVGGGNKNIAIPQHFDGWTHHILDIDPKGGAEIVLDARLMLQDMDPSQYDAVYCSHNIEHYYPHDVPKVLAGFRHVLKPNGFAQILCPDLGALIRTTAQRGLDIEDTLYMSSAGPIMVRDVIYGYGKEIETSGNDFYAHKTGFTAHSLEKALRHFFGTVWVRPMEVVQLVAFGFVSKPTPEQLTMVGIPLSTPVVLR